MGGETVAQSVRRHILTQFGAQRGGANIFVKGRFVEMMAPNQFFIGVDAESTGGEEILPRKALVGVGVLSCQGIRHPYASKTRVGYIRY